MRHAIVLVVALFLQSSWERGERLARAGDLTAAAAEFRALLAEAPDDPEIHYNLGTILVLDGRYDDARPHLEVAATAGVPPADASYNLGNTDLEPAFADSLLAERDERLRRAIESYKGALLADPTDEDAKWNLELAWRLLRRETPPPQSGGGGGGGGEGPPRAGDQRPAPTAGGGSGPQPRMTEAEAENLLRSAQERELEVQRDRLEKPQPPGPIRP